MANVSEVNASNWQQEILQSDELTLVDFWHDHCPWCIRLNPILDEVAEEYRGRVKFAKINVFAYPENRELVLHYGVMSTPTLIFFCAGKPLGSVAGLMPKEHLKHILDDVINKYRDCAKQSTDLRI